MSFTTLVTDSFNRSNGALAGSTLDNANGGTETDTWGTDVIGPGFSITSNQATCAGSATGGLIIVTSTASVGDQKVSATRIVGSSLPSGVVARWSTGTNEGNFYLLFAVNTTNLYKCVNGSYTLLATGGGTGAGDVVTLECIGTSINTYINGAADLAFTDSTHTTGQPGLYAGGAGATFDDFQYEVAGAGGAIAESLAGVATMSATLTGKGVLADSLTGAAVWSATLKGTGALATNDVGAAIWSATLTQPGLSLSLTGAASWSAALKGSGALAESMTGAASMTAGLTGTAALAMALTGVAQWNATLLLPGQHMTLVGAASMSATLQGSGALRTVLAGSAAWYASMLPPGVLLITMVGEALWAAHAVADDGWTDVAVDLTDNWTDVVVPSASWTQAN